MTPDEHRFNALILMFANLQRLMVFHNALAMRDGRELDAALAEELTSRLDLVGAVIARASEAKAVSEADAAEVLPVVPYLQHEVRALLDTPVDADLGIQAALGAAEVYASMWIDEGTIQMGTVFDRPQWVDRSMQNKPMFISLRNRANAAVVAASTGEYSDDVRADIADHAQAARNNRAQALAQIDGLPIMLDGRDAREPSRA
ncbi:hypothetical protein NQ166_06210 [Microbacterium sp. zg.Y1090]|uniref:hypothetical protein n=1 Tax=Microbacterium TaxID=33882 RepID=UPI00214C3084|nr:MULTISPECIES: hypothetical protein [unclassified Microbacterium]MCR2812131.1 hypothetical protein [Microbacterium sp. zg.Y1084]MCR2818431.1 hypothetical protein [Microbacterium sp. zg.Y1090]MDL5486244.1 hypothetical protein [Microbacterium sp. zg-Y1211]WIM29442.1 hypothetical protein QNO26_06020 [Microbacterium sp. zg-Y1090]